MQGACTVGGTHDDGSPAVFVFAVLKFRVPPVDTLTLSSKTTLPPAKVMFTPLLTVKPLLPLRAGDPVVADWVGDAGARVALTAAGADLGPRPGAGRTARADGGLEVVDVGVAGTAAGGRAGAIVDGDAVVCGVPGFAVVAPVDVRTGRWVAVLWLGCHERGVDLARITRGDRTDGRAVRAVR